MNVNNTFKIGQTVYLKTDPEQYEHIITGIMVRTSGLVYELSFCDKTTDHYEFEITADIDNDKKLGFNLKEKE
jgi:hypothetical protein